MPSASAAP